MAERHSERFGPLEVENSTEDSEDSESEMESQSESEEQPKELPPPNESQVGDLRASTSGNAMSVNGNEVETPIAGSSVHISQNNHSEGVPGNSFQTEESKEQNMMTQQEVMAGVTGEALQLPARNPLVSSPVCQTSASEPSPASVAQSMSSVSNVGNSCISVKSSSQKPSLTLAVVKASGADGYNWRKYGQKQVKSPQGSRSYFRCTYSDCCAKKIEFCDHSGHVMETIYKSQHNHDPPRKVNSVRQSRTVKTTGPVMENNATEHSFRVLSDSNPSTSSKESAQGASMVPEGRRQDSAGFNGDAKITSRREDGLESEPKHRGRKKESSHSSPVLKPGKKPKFVVHAAGDVGISGDGYRWRKYGQKMVKGKPHPRNYYRCTSAGCPARKHIETAVDNMSAVIITYKGIHDHDMPVPKKRHGLPSAPLVAAASPASLSSSQGKKPDPSPTQKSPAQGPVDAEDLTGDALELGGEKAMESARTLLSIGFEIRPC